jgi:small-conductance mechanosensitive channel
MPSCDGSATELRSAPACGRTGSTHDALVRFLFGLAGLMATVSVTLALFGLPVTQLVLGGAILGVVLGIASQQTRANLVAGSYCLRLTHSWSATPCGSGALGGQYEGEVIENGLTCVRLTTGDGPIFPPNTQLLAAAIGPLQPARSSAPA